MTTGYYCAIFPFCGGGKKKKDDKKQRHFMTGLPQVFHRNKNIRERIKTQIENEKEAENKMIEIREEYHLGAGNGMR